MIVLARLARSRMIIQAALVVAVGWGAGLAIWYFARGDVRLTLYAALECVQALIFLRMSRGRHFPVPLFFLTGGLVLYYSYAALIGAPPQWVAAFVNRAFELALVYIAGCSIYRITRRRMQKGAPFEGAPLTFRRFDDQSNSFAQRRCGRLFHAPR